MVLFEGQQLFHDLVTDLCWQRIEAIGLWVGHDKCRQVVVSFAEVQVARSEVVSCAENGVVWVGL